MLAIKEENLNMVNGGNALEELFSGPKFSVGDRVMSLSRPQLGVGIVTDLKYDKGWLYSVEMYSGTIYAYQADLEFALQ